MRCTLVSGFLPRGQSAMVAYIEGKDRGTFPNRVSTQSRGRGSLAGVDVRCMVAQWPAELRNGRPWLLCLLPQ